MLKLPVYNFEGAAVGSVDLDVKIFGVKVDPKLVQFVARMQRANAFVPYAHTKQRGEVRGGGKKPWRQKGTGRARHGSIRSPLWRGGGVTFGPTKERNMTKKVNTKERRKALQMVLADKVAHEHMMVVESWDGVTGKTKDVAKFLMALPVKNRGVILASSVPTQSLVRSAANIPTTQTMRADSLNVFDLLAHPYLVVDRKSIDILTSMFVKSRV